MGLIEQSIVRMALLNKSPIPDRIINKPVLREGLDLYIDSFFDLDTEREWGFGASAIKWSSIANYALYHEFDQEQTDRLFFFTRKLDNERLKELNKSSS